MRAFLLQTPFYRILLALIVGILLFNILGLQTLTTPFVFMGCVFFILHLFFRKREWGYKYRWLFGVSIISFIISLGIFLSSQQEKNSFFEHRDQKGSFIATISSPPKEKKNSIQLIIDTKYFLNDSVDLQETRGKAILYISKNKKAKELRTGDKIIFQTKLSQPKQRNNPEEFNYTKYLHRKGIGAIGFSDSAHWKLSKKNEKFSFVETASDIQKKLLTVYKSHQIDGDEYAILAALTLGHKDEIKEELFTSYSNSGAMHILSVSGLHVGILFLVFNFLLFFLNQTKSTRILKAVVLVTLLFCYAYITGLSPSVVRASIMFSLIAIAVSLNFKAQIYNTIFFSAFLLLIYNPNYLYNVSFLLSYSAVLSIVFFQPRFKKLLSFNNKILSLSWDLCTVSIAAQIGTFPLAIYFFHKFSNHFLLTNFIAIPIATLIIYLAILLFISSPFTLLSKWIAIALNGLLEIQNKCIQLIENLPFATFETWINELELIILYLLIIFTTLFFVKKRFPFLIITLCLFISLQSSFIVREIGSRKMKQVIVYSNPSFSGIDFISPKQHFYYTNDSAKFKKTTKAFWLKHKLTNALEISKSQYYTNGFFTFYGKKFYILSNNKLLNKKSDNKMVIDYLLFTNNTSLDMKNIENLFEVKNYIIDETISGQKRKRIRQECKEKEGKCYCLKEIGCFTLKL